MYQPVTVSGVLANMVHTLGLFYWSNEMLPILSQDQRTMSSREIAELTNKQHGHVKRDVERMVSELNLDVSRFGCIFFDQYGREQTEYKLDYELTQTLITGYSIKLRNAVIKRWQELESQLQNPQPAPMPAIPQTLPEALRLAADLAEQNQAQKEQLALAAPKVEFVDKYVEGEGLRGFRQVAKLLGAKETEFRAFLAEQKIMYKLGGGWAAYGNHLDAGRFEAKEVTNKEQGKSYAQHLFTQKGVAWIAGEWAKHKIQHNLN